MFSTRMRQVRDSGEVARFCRVQTVTSNMRVGLPGKADRRLPGLTTGLPPVVVHLLQAVDGGVDPFHAGLELQGQELRIVP